MVVAAAKQQNWEVGWERDGGEDQTRERKGPNGENHIAMMVWGAAKSNFLMDLSIRWQILGITVVGFGIYGVDTISCWLHICWVVSIIHGCWRTTLAFGCRSLCFVRGHIDHNQSNIYFFLIGRLDFYSLFEKETTSWLHASPTWLGHSSSHAT